MRLICQVSERAVWTESIALQEHGKVVGASAVRAGEGSVVAGSWMMSRTRLVYGKSQTF